MYKGGRHQLNNKKIKIHFTPIITVIVKCIEIYMYLHFYFYIQIYTYNVYSFFKFVYIHRSYK